MPLKNVTQQLLEQAITFQNLGEPQKAVVCYQEVLAREPHNADALHLLGTVASDCGDYLAAIELIHAAIEHAPQDVAELHHDLAMAYKHIGRMTAAWNEFNVAIELKPDNLPMRANHILHADVVSSDAQYLKQLRIKYAALLPDLNIQHTPRKLDSERPLRIGYLSANFGMHSAAFTFQDTLKYHNRAAFDVHLFSTNIGSDLRTKGFEAYHNYHTVREYTDTELALFIEHLEIDILIDLMGHTPGGRLGVLKAKPAPIQLTGWGYATGTGLTEVDYFITDHYHHSLDSTVEQPLYLPSFLSCSPNPTITLAPRPDRPFTYGYFGNAMKLSPAMLRIWGGILNARSDSQMIFKSGDMIQPYMQECILQNMQTDRSRVIFQGKTTSAEHMRAHQQIDLILDPYPHGGGVTTVEAMLCGVPVFSLYGKTLASRMGYSLNQQLNLPVNTLNWDMQGYWYSKRAIEYSIDARLSGMALRQAVLNSPIGNTEQYTRAVEQAYRDVWREYCGNAPA